jgi:hypothetical protein
MDPVAATVLDDATILEAAPPAPALMNRLRVIVPAFPPMPSGVGDYALFLARGFRDRGEFDSSFIVANPRWDGDPDHEGFSATAFPQRNAAALAKLLSEDDSPVLLHYSGYGYQQRGVPIWLWRGLRQWRRATNGRIVTMLHEVSASGPPWTSAFWLGPLQHWIAGRLVYRSTAVITNREASAGAADRFRHHREPLTRVVPIFSTIGEPTQVRPLAQRSRRVVVFGSAPWRIQAYTDYRLSLEKTIRAFGATEVADIGPRCGIEPKNLAGATVRAWGRLEADEVLAIMSDSIAGFVCYPADYLAKSGIFNSYCTTGMVPVTPDRRRPALDGLVPGKHFLLVGENPLCDDPGRWQSVADAAREWYSGHSLEATTSAFLEVLNSTVAPRATPATATA